MDISSFQGSAGSAGIVAPQVDTGFNWGGLFDTISGGAGKGIDWLAQDKTQRLLGMLGASLSEPGSWQERLGTTTSNLAGSNILTKAVGDKNASQQKYISDLLKVIGSPTPKGRFGVDSITDADGVKTIKINTMGGTPQALEDAIRPSPIAGPQTDVIKAAQSGAQTAPTTGGNLGEFNKAFGGQDAVIPFF